MFELLVTSCGQNQDIQQDYLLDIHDKFQVCFARLTRTRRLHFMIPRNVGIPLDKKLGEFQQFRYLSSCTLSEGNAATCW